MPCAVHFLSLPVPTYTGQPAHQLDRAYPSTSPRPIRPITLGCGTVFWARPLFPAACYHQGSISLPWKRWWTRRWPQCPAPALSPSFALMSVRFFIWTHAEYCRPYELHRIIMSHRRKLSVKSFCKPFHCRHPPLAQPKGSCLVPTFFLTPNYARRVLQALVKPLKKESSG